eukprot:1985933-Rhodomonas_salina.2
MTRPTLRSWSSTRFPKRSTIRHAGSGSKGTPDRAMLSWVWACDGEWALTRKNDVADWISTRVVVAGGPSATSSWPGSANR